MKDPYSTEGIDPKLKYNKGDNIATSTEKGGHALGSGFVNEVLFEAVPQRIQAPSETVFSGRNNTWIVLGRDRPASFGSGYGAQGVNGAGAIDLCAGMMAGSKSGPMQTAYVHPNFASDAARIYISAKTDIDDNFGLAEGKREKLNVDTTSTKGASGIGIKADGVRIIARSTGIKLITGKGNFLNTGDGGEKNASGNKILPGSAGSIELIAGNDTTDEDLSATLSPPLFELLKLFWPAGAPLPSKIARLQPIPKGDNLVSCLKYMLNIIDNLMIKVNVLAGLLMEFVAATPPAMAPLPGAIPLGVLSAAIITRLLTEVIISTNPSGGPLKQQLSALDGNYLSPQGALYINSRHCRLT